LPTGFGSNSSTNPLCDWAIFADTGTAALTNVATSATALLNNGGVHSNNTITISNVAGAAVSGSGRFESVNATSEQASATILTPLNLTLLGNTSINLYYGASNLVFGPGVIDLHLPILGPVAGIHFANTGSNKHGQQMAVSSIAFPILDFDMIERRSTTTPVDANHAPPFGAFVGANDTGTWVVSSGLPSAPSGGTYFVRGNVQFSGFSLAQGTNTNIIASGTIEIDQLSLIQSALIGSTQSLRLAAKGNVYVGRQIGQTESAALLNLLSLAGLSVGVVTTNKIAAYSLNNDVWMKLAGIATGAVTRLNLVGKQNATLATTAAIVSAPTTYCQPLY